MNKAIDIAHFIVNYCIDNNRQCTPFDLQKILYLLYKEYALKHGVEIFYDYIYPGNAYPTILSVHSVYCTFGGMPISIKVSEETKELKGIDPDLLHKIINSAIEHKPWDQPNTRDEYWQKQFNKKLKRYKNARKEGKLISSIKEYIDDERIIVPIKKNK